MTVTLATAVQSLRSRLPLQRHLASAPLVQVRRALPPEPVPTDWLVLTEADRVLAGLDAAFSRTSRWQGNAD